MNEPDPTPGFEALPLYGRASGGSRLLVWLAWVVVVLVLIWQGLLPAVLPKPEPTAATEGQAEALVDVMMRLQGRVLLAVHQVSSIQNQPMPQDEIQALEVGSVGQRQRAAVLAGVLIDPEAGLQSLARLRQAADAAGKSFTSVQEQTNDALTRAFTRERMKPTEWPPGHRIDRSRSSSQAGEPKSGEVVDVKFEWFERTPLSESDRALLRSQLGWFGELAIAGTQQGQEQQWDRFQANAMMLLVLLMSVLVGAGLLGLLGLAGLVVGLVLALKGRLRVLPGNDSPGLFIETFAVWLVTFLVLSEVVSFLQFGLFGAIVTFFLSLVALAWLPIRGMPFSRALSEIGLTWGRGFWREIGSGFAGFLMMLPILVVGVIGTLLLVKLAEHFGSQGENFSLDAGPTHPIFGVFVDPSVVELVAVFLMASVAAPIVEEIAFRGLLYRHLRDGSRRWLPWLSIAFAALLSGFIFAAIHPQGWVAIPALGSIGVALALAREWRSSLVAPMIMHGLQNGLVMFMVLLMVS